MATGRPSRRTGGETGRWPLALGPGAHRIRADA